MNAKSFFYITIETEQFAIKSSYGSSSFISNYITWTSFSFLRTDYFFSIHLLLIFSYSIFFFFPTYVSMQTSFFCLAYRVEFLSLIWSFICTIHCIWIRAMDLTRDSIKHFWNYATPFVVNGFSTSLARFSVQSNCILCEEAIIRDSGFIISIPFRSRILAPL